MEPLSPVMIPWSCKYCSLDISRARRRSICSSMITSCTGSVGIKNHRIKYQADSDINYMYIHMHITESIQYLWTQVLECIVDQQSAIIMIM